MKTAMKTAMLLLIILWGCEEDVNFWDECARLDQGVVEIHFDSKIAITVDVTRGSVEPGENDPIDLSAFEHEIGVITQFQGIYKGEAKVWVRLKGENWKFYDYVQVTPCEKTHCFINTEDII